MGGKILPMLGNSSNSKEFGTLALLCFSPFVIMIWSHRDQFRQNQTILREMRATLVTVSSKIYITIIFNFWKFFNFAFLQHFFNPLTFCHFFGFWAFFHVIIRVSFQNWSKFQNWSIQASQSDGQNLPPPVPARGKISCG